MPAFDAFYHFINTIMHFGIVGKTYLEKQVSQLSHQD